ncbi:MAG: NUDIX domain-containing protein [bacterium]|nr:NUDIX domain-containing protein [bacterium]
MHPSTQNIKVAVDNVIFTVIGNKLFVLLIQMKKKPLEGVWAMPGGLVGEKETLDDAATRILREETGVKAGFLEQLHTFSAPKRDPFGRVVSTAYMALVSAEGIKLRTTSKYMGVDWMPYAGAKKLAYDHNQILAYAKTRLEWHLEHTNIAWSLLPREFTLTELQRVYEAIRGRKAEKRNFRKMMLGRDIIASTGKSVMRGAWRPAQLYRFKSGDRVAK